MRKKSIVFIGHYGGGNTDYDSRNYFLAKELMKHGYQVTVINASFSHRLKKPKLIKSMFINNIVNGVRFISIKTPSYTGNGLKRTINMMSFVKNLYISTDNILKKIGSIDTVIMSTPHPFQFFATHHLSQKANAKLIIDLRDIWPLSIIELAGVHRWHPFILFMKFTEKLMYKGADYIISPLSNIGQYFKDSGFDGIKYSIISAGIDLKFYEEVKKNKKLTNKKKFVIGYIGALTDSNAINILLDSAQLLVEYDDIEFIIVGDGAQKKYLKTKYASVKNIFFFERVDKVEAFQYMKECDLLYRGEPNLDLYKYGTSPLKLNEYMLSATPIVQSSNYGENNLEKNVECGINVCRGNSQKLSEAILEIYNMPEEERKAMGERGKDYIIKNISYKEIVKKLITIL